MSVEREFLSLESPTMGRNGAGGMPCQGVYHRAAGSRPATAFIATHYDVDFSEHYLAGPLADRGFGFLGWNTRYRGAGTYFSLESAIVDIGVGVRWLRDVAGAERVVILGNSGGASLMAAYQAAAEGTEAGDLFVSLQAHRGRPDVLTSWLDPSVTDEADPVSIDPALDLFATGRETPLSAEFVARYRAAQVDRNHRITEWCHRELARLRGAGGSDRVFGVARTWADPRFIDLTLDPSDRPAGCYAGDPRRANYSPFGLAATTTCRTWLEMWSLEESACRAEPHLARVAVPSLVLQSTGDQGCFPSDAAAIHAALASTDKSLSSFPGDHYLTAPGARDDVADLIAGWATTH